MDNNVLISIVIPIYNAEKYLEECLESVINQTYKNIEIILLNDGSTDNSLNICNKYSLIDKRIKVNDLKHCGVSHARNVGIDISQGEYVAFVDGDDTIEPEFIEILYNTCQANNVKLGVINVNYCYNTLVKKPLTMKTGVVNVNTYYKLLLYNVKGFSCNKLYHKSLLDNICFDESITICEDLLFNVEVAGVTKHVSIVNKYLYNYRQSNMSAYRQKYNKNKITEIYAYDKILSLIQKNCPEMLIFYKYEYLLMAISQKHNYKDSSYKNEEIFSIIKTSVKKYYSEVLMSKKIKISKKIYILLCDKCNLLIKILKVIKNR